MTKVSYKMKGLFGLIVLEYKSPSWQEDTAANDRSGNRRRKLGIHILNCKHEVKRVNTEWCEVFKPQSFPFVTYSSSKSTLSKSTQTAPPTGAEHSNTWDYGTHSPANHYSVDSSGFVMCFMVLSLFVWKMYYCILY